MRFEFWGTPATIGRGGGEDYVGTFKPLTGFALGWLRWFMQIVLVFIILVPTVMTVENVRSWHLIGTDELDRLPDRAATIPVPADWTLVDTKASQTGFPGFTNMSAPEGSELVGNVELSMRLRRHTRSTT